MFYFLWSWLMRYRIGGTEYETMKVNESLWFWDAMKIFTLPCNSFFQVFLILNKFKYIVNVILKILKMKNIKNWNFAPSRILIFQKFQTSCYALRWKVWKWYYLSKISTGEQRRRVGSGEEWIRCYVFLTCNKKEKGREIIKFKERYECCLCEIKKLVFQVQS